jgi:hypothetical protein
MVFTQRPGNQFTNRPGEIPSHPSQKNPQSRAMTGPIHAPMHNPQNPYTQQHPNPYQQFQPPFQPGQQFPRESFEPQPHENKLNTTDLKGLSFWHGENESTYQDNAEDGSTTNSALKFVVAIVSVVILSSLVWLTYRWATQSHSSSVQFIKAEQGPYKVQPENPGGANFPHQEMLVYGRLSPQQFHNDQQNAEHVMPQQDDYHHREYEQAQPSQPQYASQNPNNQYQQNGQVYQAPQHPVHTEQYNAPINTGYNQNSQMQTVQQNPQHSPQYAPVPEQTLPQQSLPFQENTPQNGQPVAVQPIQQSIGQQNQADPIKAVLAEPQQKNQEQDIPLNTSTPVTSKQAAAIEDEAAKNAALKKDEKPAAKSIKGTFFIQLGTLPTAKSAKSEWERIKKNHPGEFKDLNASIKLTEIGIKKMHRIIIGPFNDRNVALKKCLKLGQGCKIIQSKPVH